MHVLRSALTNYVQGTQHGPMAGGLEKLCMLRFNYEKEDYKIMMMMMMMVVVVIVDVDGVDGD